MINCCNLCSLSIKKNETIVRKMTILCAVNKQFNVSSFATES